MEIITLSTRIPYYLGYSAEIVISNKLAAKLDSADTPEDKLQLLKHAGALANATFTLDYLDDSMDDWSVEQLEAWEFDLDPKPLSFDFD
jgi:hypothetical protein